MPPGQGWPFDFPTGHASPYGDPRRTTWMDAGGKPALHPVPREERCKMASERKFGDDVRFLTVAEVAALMRVSKMTVYRLVHSGEMPALRVGRSFRVPERAVDDYLRQSYVDTA